jgi:hypothetical protein
MDILVMIFLSTGGMTLGIIFILLYILILLKLTNAKLTITINKEKVSKE